MPRFRCRASKRDARPISAGHVARRFQCDETPRGCMRVSDRFSVLRVTAMAWMLGAMSWMLEAMVWMLGARLLANPSPRRYRRYNRGCVDLSNRACVEIVLTASKIFTLFLLACLVG
eukprot:380995-Pyramimonas_sp.AAC.1